MAITIDVVGNNPMIVTGHTPLLSVGAVDLRPGTPIVSVEPNQVVGLVPLKPCEGEDCRQFCPDDYFNKVFGELVPGPSYQQGMTYENDWSSFLIDTKLYNANPATAGVTFVLEKLFEGEWLGSPFGVNLNTNVFGQYFPLNTISGHPSYAGYAINWGSILFHAGAGCYRFKATTKFTTFQNTGQLGSGTQGTLQFDLASPCSAGRINGKIQTISGGIPMSYIIAQNNAGFSLQDNIEFIRDIINNGTAPYNATSTPTSLTINGEDFSQNNGIVFQLVLFSPFPDPGCEYVNSKTMLGGIEKEPVLTSVIIEGCLVSDPFFLREWDCERAKGTVKFEAWLKGVVGDKRKDLVVYDLCDMFWYDSKRYEGFFGYYKVTEYLKTMLEWGQPQAGQQIRVKDEAIQQFEYKSKLLPFEYQERFSVYGMMSDELFVSDYNLYNSDWDIKRMPVVYESNFEPEYFDARSTIRRSKVDIEFRRGFQNVIKSICCPVVQVVTSG